MKESPAYLRIYERLRQDIVAGEYPYGARLPGKRALAERMGVSTVTVAHALDMLSDEGYLLPRQRSGCFVRYRAEEGFAGEETPPETPKAELPSSADVDGFSFPLLARTMRRVLSEEGERIMIRPPAEGLPALRVALSRYLARSRGLHAGPEQIVIGAGAEYLYGILTELLGAEGAWAIENPSYEKIERVYRARGIRLCPLPMDREGIEPGALRSCGARVLHVSPYRSYPSDVTASASRRREYLRWADREPGRWLIEDDYESEFNLSRRPADTLFAASEKENVLYLNTFSRTISPALRVGYLVLPRPLAEVYRERAGFHSCPAPVFEQYVLAELLDSGQFERHLNRVRRRLRENRKAAENPESGREAAEERQRR